MVVLLASFVFAVLVLEDDDGDTANGIVVAVVVGDDSSALSVVSTFCFIVFVVGNGILTWIDCCFSCNVCSGDLGTTGVDSSSLSDVTIGFPLNAFLGDLDGDSDEALRIGIDGCFSLNALLGDLDSVDSSFVVAGDALPIGFSWKGFLGDLGSTGVDSSSSDVVIDFAVNAFLGDLGVDSPSINCRRRSNFAFKSLPLSVFATTLGAAALEDRMIMIATSVCYDDGKCLLFL